MKVLVLALLVWFCFANENAPPSTASMVRLEVKYSDQAIAVAINNGREIEPQMRELCSMLWKYVHSSVLEDREHYSVQCVKKTSLMYHFSNPTVIKRISFIILGKSYDIYIKDTLNSAVWEKEVHRLCALLTGSATESDEYLEYFESISFSDK